MKKIPLLMCVLLVSTGSFCAHARVDGATEAERRYLIKIANELAHLKKISEKAAAEADPDARFTLDYVALQKDLQAMQRALENHINKPSRSPRRIMPLQLVGQQ